MILDATFTYLHAGYAVPPAAAQSARRLVLVELHLLALLPLAAVLMARRIGH